MENSGRQHRGPLPGTMAAMSHDPPAPSSALLRNGLWLAVALSMGAAVSLGITRFAYALLLPPMREDLSWSYTLAGAMNTVNALGYLLGALATPMLLRRFSPGTLLVAGSVLATVFMGLCGFFVDAVPLLVQRLLAGVASALVFVCGGLLAARLGAQQPGRSGLLLGLYYGGTGWGISLSAVLVPAVLATAPGPHPGPGRGGHWPWPAWQPRWCCCGRRVRCSPWRHRPLPQLPRSRQPVACAGRPLRRRCWVMACSVWAISAT